MNTRMYLAAEKDFACHSVDFEWWYADGVFDNGYHFSCMVYFGSPLGHNPNARLVTITVIPPGGGMKVAIVHNRLEDTFASTSAFDVKSGECSLGGRSPTYRVRLCGDDIAGSAMKVDLTYKQVVPGVRQPPDGCIVGRAQEPRTGVYLTHVLRPRFDVAGKIRLGNEEIAVKGVGYMDHQWGMGKLMDIMGGINWGRHHLPNCTVAYWDAYLGPAFGNQRHKQLWVFHGRELVEYNQQDFYVDVLEVKPLDLMNPLCAIHKKRVLLFDGATIQGTITEHIREIMIPPGIPVFNWYYNELLADCEADLVVEGEKIKGALPCPSIVEMNAKRFGEETFPEVGSDMIKRR